MIGRVAAAVTGPRGRWVTIAVWVAIGVAGFLARSHIDDVTAAGQTSFLPKNAESTRALDALEAQPQSRARGEEVPAVIVFERDGGLTEADLDAIGRIGDGLNELKITGATPIIDPFSADAASVARRRREDRQRGRADLARRRSGAGRAGDRRRRPRRDRQTGVSTDPRLPRRTPRSGASAPT